MTKFLSSLLRNYFSFCFVILCSVCYGQTLATYQFNNTLNATGATIGTPQLRYYNSSGTQVTPAFVNGGVFGGGSRMLNTNDEGAYVELTINTTGYYGITVSWYGEVNAGWLNGGTWSLFADTGSGYGASLFDMDLFNFLAFFSDSRTESHTLGAAADNNPNLKIRIKASDISSNLRLDNLIITSQAPKINVFGYNTTSNLAQIPQLAAPATIYGTDFGMVHTEDPNALTRTFRITNNGAAALTISSISFSGDNPGDFSWVPNPATPAPTPGPTDPINSLPATIAVGTSRDFIVRFNPSDDGKRSALLNIVSNANPSPYSFYVEGRGSACATVDLGLRTNTMETSQSPVNLLPSTLFSGAQNFIVGKSNPNGHTTSNNVNGINTIRLYPNSTSNSNNATNSYDLYSSSDRSWYVYNAAGVNASDVAFGPVDISAENGVSISFNIAAFGTTTNASFTSNETVELRVLKPGTTDEWSSEVILFGGQNSTSSAAENSRYPFNFGTTATAVYDGDGAPQTFINGSTNNANNKYNRIVLKFLGTANFQNLVFRIIVSSGNNTRMWLIDDVAVNSANKITRIWNGTVWKDRLGNTVTDLDEATKSYKNYKALIQGNYTVPTSGLTVCECEVADNAILTIPSNRYLTVQSAVTNLGDGSNFIVESDGNLKQTSSLQGINDGNITVRRNMNLSTVGSEYNYLATPVVFAPGQSFKTIYPGVTGTSQPQVLYYVEKTRYFYPSSGANILGRSSAVKEVPKALAPLGRVEFKGEPFVGDIVNYPLDYSPTGLGFNLVGNPYPSNVDLKVLYTQNSASISPDFRFWDNTVNTNGGVQHGANYNGRAYARYNALSDTGNRAGFYWTPQNNTSTGGKKPNRILKVGQGMMVQALENGSKTLTWSNPAALKITDNTDSVFFGKTSTPDRFWIALQTPDQLVLSSAVVYKDGLNDAFEKEDSDVGISESDSFYTFTSDNEKVVINGKNFFDIEDVVPLGTVHFAAGTYKLAILEKEGVFEDSQRIYLYDKQLGIYTDLAEGTYTFTTEAGEYNNRFEIVYKTGGVLATSTSVKGSVEVYRDGQDFVIRSTDKLIDDVELYDGIGRLIMKVPGKSSKELRLNSEQIATGMFVLKVVMQDGQVLSKKLKK